MIKGAFLFLLVTVLAGKDVAAQVHKLDTGWHHLRNGEPREWSEFPEHAEKQKFTLHFPARPNADEQTLSLRQYDVKLTWKIVLNGEPLGFLVNDEKDLLAYYEIGPGKLKTANILEIFSEGAQPDDIRLGHVMLSEKSLDSTLSEARLTLEIIDFGTQEKIPARITIVDERGTLQSVSGSAKAPLAIRPGYVYTGNGEAVLGLPAGTYTLYANRGFEYGADSVEVVLYPGDTLAHKFHLRREVSTTGWAASDTHIHTHTWSGHGDASASERVLTIAGEGVELPVITDHNVHVDLKPFAIQQNVNRFFTPVTGNEVTTPAGHFNVFPVSADEPVINSRADNWKTLAQNIRSGDRAKVIILNHARDIHMKFRPFDPARHMSSAGMRLDGSEFFPNAMEVLNSGSQQTDQRELLRDWFGMLNHGHVITPVGSSDSHDVSRYLVGQARTYVRCTDDHPGNIDLREAVRNFREGNVMVSFGLLAEIEVNDAYGPGEFVPASGQVKVRVTVSGPAWAAADSVALYANGQKIREEKIEDRYAAGVKWSGTWNLALPAHDVFLVTVATGPAPEKPFWPIAKPYQPVSPEWQPRILGLSGAVWVDADQNRMRNSARYYAERLLDEAGTDMDHLIRSLASFDQPVSVQAAALLYKSGKDLSGPEITRALTRASPQTYSGFKVVIEELKEGGK